MMFKKFLNLFKDQDKTAKTASNKENTGTVLRTDAPKETQEKPKTVLEIAEEQDWEVKEVPVYEVGDVIDGEYKVEKVFSGGMGHVYIAHSQQQQLRFAIKQPNEMMLSNKSFFARVLREADAWTDLGMHPHIAYCYFVKKIDGVPYIFIEYVDGGNLREWIAEGKCADFKAGIEMAIQFCHGMEHAHQKGMMHRDIKPENVLMTKDGKVKVTDFGLAGVVEKGEGRASAATGGDSLTRLGDVMGTEAYMSPEQWADPHNVGPASDVFSFGVCMWEMFCGRRPYQVAVGEVEAPPEPHSLRTDIPEQLSEILQKAIDLEKDKRQKDFTQLREELNDVHKELSGEEAANFQIKIPDTLADELCNRGYSYNQLGDNNRALECWEKALQADPHHIESTYNRGLLLWRSGQLTDDALVKQMQEMQTSHAADWQDEYYLGLVHMERGDAESGIEVLERALEQSPESTEIKRALTTARNSQGKFPTKMIVVGALQWVTSVSIRGGWALVASSEKLHLWQMHYKIRCVRILEGHTGKVNSVSISPDGHSGLSSSDDTTLRLWELATGACTRTFKGHTGKVNSVSISPDGHSGLSGSDDKTLRVWELATGKCIRTLEGHTGKVNSVSINPDGRYGLSGSDDQTLRLWEFATGKCIRIFEGHEAGVVSATISGDGRRVLSGGGDGTVRLWDISTGRCERILGGDLGRGGINAVSISPDGCWGLSGGWDETARLWDLVTGRCVRTFEHGSPVYTVSINQDGQWGLSGTWRGNLMWLPLRRSEFVGSFVVAVPLGVGELSEAATSVLEAVDEARSALDQGHVSAAAREIARAREFAGYERDSSLLEMWHEIGVRGRCHSLSSGWFLREFAEKKVPVSSVCISPDRRWGLSGSWALCLWELATGKCIRVMEGHTSWVRSVGITPDGCFGLSGSDDKTLRVWELATGKCIRTLEGHTGKVNSVSISPDGRYGLSGSDDQTLRFWELATGKCIRTFEGHKVGILSVTISGDGRRALSGSSNGTMRLWDLATGDCIGTFEGHRGKVNSVSISPDGCWGLSGSDDKTLRLWELAKAKCIRVLEGHKNWVSSVVFSPDGNWAISGGGFIAGGDNSVRLWHLATGRCVRIFEGHAAWVHSVGISQDSRWVLSGSFSGALRLWELVWDYEFPDPVDWDDGVTLFAQNFLTLYNNKWTKEQFERFYQQLQYAGFGWVRKEGVLKKLKEMAGKN